MCKICKIFQELRAHGLTQKSAGKHCFETQSLSKKEQKRRKEIKGGRKRKAEKRTERKKGGRKKRIKKLEGETVTNFEDWFQVIQKFEFVKTAVCFSEKFFPHGFFLFCLFKDRLLKKIYFRLQRSQFSMPEANPTTWHWNNGLWTGSKLKAMLTSSFCWSIHRRFVVGYFFLWFCGMCRFCTSYIRNRNLYLKRFHFLL